ncbi:MAG: BamA/TamA family outer membrane protein [Bacteroidetes bacterium]|nr:BamA/TamA family outer membrane protein [Bacteroidota bacterium]
MPRLYLMLVAAVLALLAPQAWAQAPLFLANDSTTVRAVDFRFIDTQTFSEDELRALLATKGPTFTEKLWRRLPFARTKTYPLEPIEVQKDVVRIRQFYRLNGFFDARIDYPASQLDTAANTIRIVYSIVEGKPMRVRRMALYAQDSTGDVVAFPASLRRGWSELSSNTSLRPGARFTSVDYAVLKGEVLDWALNHGYPFANVQADSTLDLDSLAIDLALTLTPGPRARIDSIEVRGNTSVPDNVVRRELPLQTGEYFSQRRLVEGQRELFGLGLFRVAVARVPAQPEDSTVTVRYEVRQGKIRLLRATTGYSRDEGAVVQGDWTHRNFWGEARQLNIAVVARTGFAAFPTDGLVARRLSVTASLRQPYLFNRRTSGMVAPFVLAENEPNLGNRYLEYGAAASVLYELMEFRTLSAQYTFGRVQPLELGGLGLGAADVYNRSVLTGSAVWGRVNSFLNPRSGFLLRPTVESAGRLLASGVDYTKISNEATFYTVLSRRADGAARLYLGRLFPQGTSKDQNDPLVEYRFDRIRFYAGGASDVRGWGLNQLGPQLLRVDSVYAARTSGGPLDSLTVRNGRYEAIGGLAKFALNLEARLSFPGLGEKWRLAAFVDAGQVTEGSFSPADLRVGVGSGVRYYTPVGYIRLDVAVKVNPSETDRYDPLQLYERRYGVNLPGVSQPGPFLSLWRRIGLHFSIGQAF